MVFLNPFLNLTVQMVCYCQPCLRYDGRSSLMKMTDILGRSDKRQAGGPRRELPSVNVNTPRSQRLHHLQETDRRCGRREAGRIVSLEQTHARCEQK